MSINDPSKRLVLDDILLKFELDDFARSFERGQRGTVLVELLVDKGLDSVQTRHEVFQARGCLRQHIRTYHEPSIFTKRCFGGI